MGDTYVITSASCGLTITPSQKQLPKLIDQKSRRENDLQKTVYKNKKGD